MFEVYRSKLIVYASIYYICTHTCIYIYIYIYVRERERDRLTESYEIKDDVGSSRFSYADLQSSQQHASLDSAPYPRSGTQLL